MKVYIGPYRSWIGPYQIGEKIAKILRLSEEKEEALIDWLCDSKIADICQWIDSKKKRKIKVRIDKYDGWNADHTLALIILPLLKEVRDSKAGSPFTDDEDVPEELRSHNGTKENEWDVDSLHHKRWEYVLGEMIFAFENIVDSSWEEKFHSGVTKFENIPLENGLIELVEAADSTGKFDYEGYKVYSERIQNGTRLFGKYYQSLWT